MWYKRPYNFFIYSSLMIIVTGGAGFIGSNIVAALEKAGKKDLVVVDELGSSDKWKNIAKRELCAVIPPEDMLDYMEAHAEEIEAVIHMGAISATTETDADLIIRTNFTLSWRLWEFCALYGKQFIYASSAATYGDGSMGFDDDSSLEHVNALRPLNAYGWSKALFDRKVAREVKEGRPVPPQYAGLKFFNVYGPNEYHKGGQKSVVAHIFPQVKVNETVKLFKSYHPDYRDGWQLRAEMSTPSALWRRCCPICGGERLSATGGLTATEWTITAGWKFRRFRSSSWRGHTASTRSLDTMLI